MHREIGVTLTCKTKIPTSYNDVKRSMPSSSRCIVVMKSMLSKPANNLFFLFLRGFHVQVSLLQILDLAYDF